MDCETLGLVEYNKIRKIINTWDPMKIIYDYSDEDEYSGEIKAIENFIKETDDISKEVLAKFILDYFNQQFADSLGENLDECEIVAEKILISLSRNGSKFFKNGQISLCDNTIVRN